jgi:pimeloyl-ACP methyl ester carboxylesterase
MAATQRPGATGPALLLVHGFLDDRTVWNAVAGRLSERYAVTATDLPGWGDRRDDDGPFTLQRYADDVAETIDAAAGPVILIGHSMGAPVAELAVAARPDRVAGLVLLSPIPMSGVHLDSATAAVFRSFGGNAEAQRAGRLSVAAALTDAALDELVRTGMLARPQAVAETFDAWNEGLPGGDRVSEYKGPALILRGAADPFLTRELLRSGVTGRFQSPTVREVAGAGHVPHVEAPAEVARLVEEFAGTVLTAVAGGNRARDVKEQAWTDAFANKSADNFGSGFAADVVLEAATLRVPVQGRSDVQVVMQTASSYYASLVFTHEAVNGPRTYMEWEAEAPTGTKFSGVTILTRDDEGLISHIAIHHRPLDAALEFSAEMSRRTKGKIDPEHWYAD